MSFNLSVGGAKKVPTRGFQPLRDLPTVLWLLLVVVAALAHRELPAPRWLMIHLLLLGAVTHAILVWSQHFSFALLRSAPATQDHRQQMWRLTLANSGAALVITGVLTSVWLVTAAGAAALLVAVIWHGTSLVLRSRRALAGRFGRTIRYYIAAAAFLPIGIVIGAWLAREASDALTLAHALINVLGWIGLTVAGTLVTLWPTILRTRADDDAAPGAARALPVFVAGVALSAVGAAGSWIVVLAVGLIGYLAGLGIIGISLWRAARRSPPRTFAALSVAAAMLWWIGAMVVLVIAVVSAWVSGNGLPAVQAGVDAIVPYLAAGFVAQVLIGALSYLVPVVLGGGPSPVRVGTAAFDRAGALRIAVANTALFVCALPVSSLIRVVVSALYLVAVASFLPILFVAMRAQRRAKADGVRLSEPRQGPIVPEGDRPPGRRAGQAVAGMLSVVLAVAVCAAIAPQSMGLTSAPVGADDADAPVITVAVEAANMRFTPDVIDVPVGTRLVIELTNTDAGQLHDLVFANGAGGSRLAPGDTETIDVGVITADVDGWCSIAGHRQMGMTLTVRATGAATPDAEDHDHGSSDATGHDRGSSGAGESLPEIDLAADPGEGFEPYDAVLPSLPVSDSPVTHEITLPVTEQVQEVAPGIRQRLWTFGGTAPGPVLHGRVGDTFVITLVNDGTIGHSIDFHAGALAPDEPMRTIAPGESLTYTFTATRSGIWMYHCSTAPMSAHIANGMYGAVIIEPAELPPVDRSYVLVQGEYYLGAQDSEIDMDKLAAGDADLVTFNGYAMQYAHAPLPARVGERVRIWVLDAGPDRASSFHVVGGQFDTVWSEGRYLIDRAADTGSQALGLLPAQGGFVELVFPEAGHYPFVSHIMTDAERGAHGMFEVIE
ncbi:multicopper oxidase domain-containing protein [Microbacterium sp. A84]|uniref:multicopper oxidase domain-containing protein n=1 Tax=Microbacterium sp. A84 TaxID=3450715 RepID=UPI003F443FBA